MTKPRTTTAAEEAAATEAREAPKHAVSRDASDGWLPAEEHYAIGKAARGAVPRKTQAGWLPPGDRPDPIAQLRAQDARRLPELVPIRWGRMSVSPFTFFRGAALTMAADLAATPSSGLRVQLCGDAHIMNFGVFAAPDRTPIFDVADFDETLPGPWEWDLKRLAASVVIAARDRGFTKSQGHGAALAAARSYRAWMRRYAAMTNAEVWHSRVAADDALALAKAASKAGTGKTGAVLARAREHAATQAFAKLTHVVDGVPRFTDDPPLIAHLAPGQTDMDRDVRQAFRDYKKTLQDDHRALLDRYAFVDLARKVVGVSSVGTVDLVVLMMGRDDGDPLILQIKEAGASSLEAFAGRSIYRHHGHRVVAGQRLMQAASDIFLGWIRGAAPDQRDFYWRQLRDFKGSVPMEQVRPAGLAVYAAICGWTLARAHARSGDRMAIAAYLGKSDRFDQALAAFAQAYADQAERDYERLTAAIKQGEVQVETGV
jgi:uncharacterized protein (DUF2252 family)